ncbi:MAG: hypothetical protein NW216_02100 [Hyphomicrobium sp.]|nr:hypothetical protein [Hyphomicrobium sp.]
MPLGPPRRLSIAALAALVSSAAALAGPKVATKLWETTGFKNPESALFDAGGGTLYVSNVNGEPLAKDGNGFISKVAPDGTITTLEWVKGFDGPKGLAKVGGKLYVSDIDQLVEIDIATAAIVARYPAKDAKFMNDVAADSAGNVYVSDTGTSTIWRLSGGAFEIWLADPKLENPNGLLVEGDKMLVASWGGGSPDKPSRMFTVDLATKAIAPHGLGEPIGNLDGLEPDGDGGYFLTDWVAGNFHRVGRKGKVRLLMDLGQGAADLGYDPATKTVYVPQMMTSVLFAFKVE